MFFCFGCSLDSSPRPARQNRPKISQSDCFIMTEGFLRMCTCFNSQVHDLMVGFVVWVFAILSRSNTHRYASAWPSHRIKRQFPPPLVRSK